MGNSSRIHGMTRSQAVTPNNTVSDATAITNPSAPGDSRPMGFIVGVAGDVALVYHDGSTDTLPAMVAGVVHACQFTHITATGTTATGIHAVFL